MDIGRITSSAEATDYLEFLRATLPEGWTVDPPHIRMIAGHIDALERGEIDRLAIHMPPRHGKSETVTYRLPLKWLLRNVGTNVLVTGYNQRFASKLGRRARNHAKEWGILAPDKKAADEWETTSGGLFVARGVGSPPTGIGFSLVVIDDPIKRREDAESEVFRENAWDWYSNDIYTRLEPSGAIVLIMTLWHEDDIGSQAVASEPGRWTVLKLPAIAEEDDPLGRAPGEALWPERYDVPALKRLRSVLSAKHGERSWQALYQQNPTPREGVFFKVDRLDIVDAADLPETVRRVRAWDLAATEREGDYTAGVLMGVDACGVFYVIDVARGQWSTDERNARIRKVATMDGRGVAIRGPQDPGAAGKEASTSFVRMLRGYSVHVHPVSGKKSLRADPFSAQVNAGNVRLVRGDWNSALIEELRTFPLGKHDDQVDAASDAFVELVQPDEAKLASARPVYAAVHRA
ncbi:MAG: phage terminase large subunit [Capsulimonadaceae bacterium]|nr:phage terminase large subunit [Capsulimonadaceae bacterium]